MRTRTQHQVIGTTQEDGFFHGQQQRAHDELQFFDSTTVKFEQTTRGIRAHARAVQNQQVAAATRYRVKGVYSTYLVCRTWDGTAEGGSDVYVAKPPHLRWYATAWPGMTIVGDDVTFTHALLTSNMDGKRVAHDVTVTDNADQTEIIVPVWQWGNNDTGSGSGVLGGYDEIFADTPEGGTGVTTIAETTYTPGVESSSGTPAAPAPVGTVLTLMDDNRNGRYWEQIA